MTFNYTKNSSLVGPGEVTTRTGVHDLDANKYYVRQSAEFNFFVASAPAGISTFTSGIGTYSYGWSATNGLMTAGDAGTSFVYTVQTTDAFTGNYLIQASFRYGGTDNCPDASICIYPSTNARTSPVWNWGVSSTRISIQNDCNTSAWIYGFTTSASTSSTWTFTSGTWYTQHFYHEPSLNRCRYAMTAGQNDWTRSGSLMFAEATLSSASISGSYYIGLGSDADSYTLGSNSCNFSGLKITPI